MGQPVRFPSTFWSTINEQPTKARTKIYTLYRTPIYNFILNHGFQPSDADDLTQEIFVRVCRSEFLRKADQKKGKFRSLLLGVTRHLVWKHREKSARRKAMSLENFDVPDNVEPSEEFDRLWTQNLVRMALQKLMEEGGDGPKYYEALILNKMSGLSYREVAGKLGATESEVTNWIHRAKDKMKAHLGELVKGYASTEEEYDTDIRLVGSFS